MDAPETGRAEPCSTAQARNTGAGEGRMAAMLKLQKLWKKSNAKVLDFLHSLCFIGPSFLGVLMFFIVPFGVVVYYSVIRSP
jgi:hypothetical protein